jgi:hypothetical protein
MNGRPKKVEGEAEGSLNTLDSFQRVLHQDGMCCICEGRVFPESKHTNILLLDKIANWKFPVWGNILLNLPAVHASAIVCDSCVEGTMEDVKYAIEFDAKVGAIIYHPVSELKDRERS